jgi:hypothetical protein
MVDLNNKHFKRTATLLSQRHQGRSLKRILESDPARLNTAHSSRASFPLQLHQSRSLQQWIFLRTCCLATSPRESEPGSLYESETHP